MVHGIVTEFEPGLGLLVTLDTGHRGTVAIQDIGPEGLLDIENVFKQGMEIEVACKNVFHEDGALKMSLSMPSWDAPTLEQQLNDLRNEFPPDTRLLGIVNNILDDLGVFVTLRPGISGLARWNRIGLGGCPRPSKFFSYGDQVVVEVLDVELQAPANKLHVSLAIPDFTPPLDEFVEKFPIGSRIVATAAGPPVSDDTEGTRLVPATEISTGMPVFLASTDQSYWNRGEKFEAEVVDVDREQGRILLSQARLYGLGDQVRARVTTEPREDNAGDLYLHVRIIGANAPAFLHWRNIPFSSRKVFASITSDKTIGELFVLSSDARHGILLGTRESYHNRQRCRGWAQGERLGRCKIEKLQMDEGGDIVGVNVEIVECIWGYVPRWRLSFADQASMAEWQPGDYTPPLVIENLTDPDSRRWRYGLVAQDVFDAASVQFRPGEPISGVVTGCRIRNESDLSGVEVEVAPGRTGFVPVSAQQSHRAAGRRQRAEARLRRRVARRDCLASARSRRSCTRYSRICSGCAAAQRSGRKAA